MIAKAPLRLDKLLRRGERRWNRLLSTAVGRFLYRNLRQVDRETRDILYQLRVNGRQIVIVTYAFEEPRREIERWLEKNRVPFDKLFLAKKEESPLEFKVRAIKEAGCHYFIEDQSALAQGIAREVPGVRVIHYRKKEDLNVLLNSLKEA